MQVTNRLYYDMEILGMLVRHFIFQALMIQGMLRYQSTCISSLIYNVTCLAHTIKLFFDTLEFEAFLLLPYLLNTVNDNVHV